MIVNRRSVVDLFRRESYFVHHGQLHREDEVTCICGLVFFILFLFLDEISRARRAHSLNFKEKYKLH